MEGGGGEAVGGMDSMVGGGGGNGEMGVGSGGVDRFRRHVNVTSQALALPSPIKPTETEFTPPPPVIAPTFAPPTIIAPRLTFSKEDSGIMIQVSYTTYSLIK